MTGSSAERRNSHIGSAPSAACSAAAEVPIRSSGAIVPSQKSTCSRSAPRVWSRDGSQCGLSTNPLLVRICGWPRKATSNCSSISSRRLYSEAIESSDCWASASASAGQPSKLAVAELVSRPQLMSTTSRAGPCFRVGATHFSIRLATSRNEIGTRNKAVSTKLLPSTSPLLLIRFASFSARGTAFASAAITKIRQGCETA